MWQFGKDLSDLPLKLCCSVSSCFIKARAWFYGTVLEQWGDMTQHCEILWGFSFVFVWCGVRAHDYAGAQAQTNQSTVSGVFLSQSCCLEMGSFTEQVFCCSMCSCSQIFLWVLGIWTQVVMITEQAFLSTSLFPQVSLMLYYWNSSGIAFNYLIHGKK